MADEIKSYIKSYMVYQCPICNQKYLSKEEADNCFIHCKKVYHEIYKTQITLTLSNKSNINGECYTLSEKRFIRKEALDKLLNEVTIFFHYDQVDFTGYSLSNDKEANKETILRIKKCIVEWLEERIKFTKNFLIPME